MTGPTLPGSSAGSGPTQSPSAVLDVFRGAAGAVAETLARQHDWGPSGERAGQYAVDLVADAACVEVLRAAGFGVLSEESGRSGPSRAMVVVVDPLDGSTNASRGLPWCATALCLVDGGGAAVALVRNHGTAEEFTAVRGEGAWRDGEPVRVADPVDLAAAIVGVSGPPPEDPGWAQFRALGAAAPDICAVASGALDGWCDMSTDAHGVWDYLAAVLVCTEAGGVAADALGRDLLVLDPDARRTPVVASSPALLDDLVTLRSRHR